MKNDVTIIISAFNEEKNIKGAVEDVIAAVKRIVPQFEIIIVDDGSTDATLSISSEIERRYKNIRVIRNQKNLGLGRSFAKAIRFVTASYLTVFPGDNDMAAISLVPLLKMRQEADLITAYMKTDKDRTFVRRTISRFYVLVMNLLFGLSLRYYNGPFVVKTAAVRSINLHSAGLDIYAETKVRMIKKGFTYKEIPFEHTGRKHGKSTAISLKSILRTVRNTINLYCDL